MASPLKMIPSDELIIECCKALAARNENGGTWPNGKGCPECMWDVARAFNQADQISAIAFVENYVGGRAIKMVAEMNKHDP